MKIQIRFFLSVLALVLSGCASMLVESYFEDVEATVQPVWMATMTEALKKQGLTKVPRPVETRVDVFVDAKGKVLNVRLGRSSGLDYINTASVETFRRVAQLPPPPKQMLIDGTARLDWGFVIVE